MRVHTHLEAELDLLQIVIHLSEQSLAAAEAFEAELARTLTLLCAFPDVGRDAGGARSMPLRRFEYNVIYQVKSDRLFVVAVAHQRRAEHDWRHRL